MRIIDLSRPIEAGMEVHPGDPQVKVEVDHTYGTHGWLLHRLTMGTHTGTHVDAPIHMDPDGKSLSDLPLERFIGPARVTEVGANHPTGVGLLFLDQVGPEELDAVLVAGAPFVGGPLDERLERALLQRGVITYTGLRNLDLLPRDETFRFFGLPLPIVDGDGSPVRAVAILEEA